MTTGTEECGNIASTSFLKNLPPTLTPAFTKATLMAWTYSFLTPREKLGDEYMIDFGSEPIDYGGSLCRR